ncbi:MAG: SpoIID/LytB domain-containing protein [Gemmatimonadetes bacterium]|nr:SpoIID/LytB domain-containing protein [Gemmatimonadota bacterium]
MAVAALLGGCPRIEVGGVPETESAEPVIRVGLGGPARELTVGGGDGLIVAAPDGGGLAAIPAGRPATASVEGSIVVVRSGGSMTTGATVSVKPGDPSGFVRVNGRDYRGELLLTPATGGILAVNVLTLEGYVAGVVNAEMGRRPPADSQAVFAQAVISRTVAVRSIGRYRVRGYDLVSTVSDQAYGGVVSETEAGWAAVRATRGEVLTYNGAVIEAFFHSTCGGRTEAVEEVFSGAPQVYLRSVSDRDPAGTAYCAISPRFRWREEWAGEDLVRVLRANAGIAKLSGDQIPVPGDLQVGARSPTGRVAELLVTGGGRVVPLGGQQVVRQVLRGADGGWLRSTAFSVQATRSGGRIVRLVAEGGGNGHGVGMCQWGAVGRARAGFSYPDILSAYFPGTEIRRLF